MPTVDHQPRTDRRNGWLEILGPLPEPDVFRGEETVDHVVVGASWTGLAAARRLAELDPAATIVVLDADLVGNSAGGRSSGFAIDMTHDIRAGSFAPEDVERELRQMAMNTHGQRALQRLVEEHDLGDFWDDVGKVHGAATPRGEHHLDEFASMLDTMGQPHTSWDRSATVEHLGTDFWTRALHTPGTVLVQPAGLLRGIAAALPGNVAVHERSAVMDVDYGPPHTVRTTQGTVRTPSLVLATNGYGPGFGFYRKHTIPLMTWGSMTRQLDDDEWATIGGDDTWGLIAAEGAGTTVRKLGRERRIVVRNIFSFSRRSRHDGRWLATAERTHRRSFDRRFPSVAGTPFEFTWGGPVSLSRNGQPAFGELRPGVQGSIVHNGVGIVRGTVCGMLLADSMHGAPSEHLDLMLAKGRPSRNFPEPFNSLGVRANLRWRRYRAGIEE